MPTKSLETHPLGSLFVVYLIWKSFLFALALLSPGSGYDTSAALLGRDEPGFVGNFVRWDAIYFTKIAQRGYIFEQEWAFGWGGVLGLVASGLGLQSAEQFPKVEAWIGIAISHIAHLGSITTLYYLCRLLFQSQPDSKSTAFVASCLHILSPAGIFLSAPYGESLFSCFHIGAYYLYARGLVWELQASFWKRDTAMLLSGLFVALATSVRSNGLASGLLFLHEVLHEALPILQHSLNMRRARKLAVTVLAGLLVSCGSIIPQYIAYQEYCSEAAGADLREWCSKMPPSIYNFVQSHYWNCGFLRYWTLSNLPLFVIAIPSFALLLLSVGWILGIPNCMVTLKTDNTATANPRYRAMRAFAITQFLIAFAILTSYHVQIINRLSSGYPLWYMWLSSLIVSVGRDDSQLSKRRKVAKTVVRWMVMYSMIQGALFASFLPPA